MDRNTVYIYLNSHRSKYINLIVDPKSKTTMWFLTGGLVVMAVMFFSVLVYYYHYRQPTQVCVHHATILYVTYVHNTLNFAGCVSYACIFSRETIAPHV